MKKLLFTLTLYFVYSLSSAQTIKILHEDSSSYRGLSVVDDDIVWVSGSNGTVGKSIDGGVSWKWMKIPGFEKIDFRDIEAFDKNTAVIMGVSAPAYLLRTTDGGETWQTVYKNNTRGIFLDAMAFFDNMNGVVIGDPIENKFFIAITADGGKTWQPIPENERPVADSGEACFASSGTNVRKLSESKMLFISGGLTSNLFIKNQKFELPIIHGKETTGANSIAVKNKKNMIVVGGDYTKKDDAVKNCVITRDGGITWKFPVTSPNGYRSCVEHITRKKWITCGLNGVDISTDDGNNWKSMSLESFHVVQKAKNGNAVFFAGNKGKIGKLIL